MHKYDNIQVIYLILLHYRFPEFYLNINFFIFILFSQMTCYNLVSIFIWRLFLFQKEANSEEEECSDLDIEHNTNVSSVLALKKEQRERAKEESLRKKEKDKEDR